MNEDLERYGQPTISKELENLILSKLAEFKMTLPEYIEFEVDHIQIRSIAIYRGFWGMLAGKTIINAYGHDGRWLGRITP